MKLLNSLLVLTMSLFSFAQTQFGADIDGEAAGDKSGWSVSLSDDGTILAIGAASNNGNGYESGHVRIYEYSIGSWTQLGSDIDGEASSDVSGFSVSLSDDGNRVAIGAIFNAGNGYRAGHVRVYEYSNGSWTQLGSDIDGEAAINVSGWAVSLSDDGDIVAIGAPKNADNGVNAGHVRIYEYSIGSWTQLGSDIDGEAAVDNSGWFVSLSDEGDVVAIGAPFNDGNGSNAGHVRVYEYSSGTWTQLGTDIDGEAVGDNSGYSVSLSDDGDVVAIGAPGNAGNGTGAGHVRVYELDSNSTWTQLGSDIDGEATWDNSGYSVSLSDDGDVVAIGAPYNAGSYGNPSGTDAGHVRVYEYSNGTWTQLGSDIDGEAAGDNSGDAVSLSDDGTVVAIGAPNNDGNGSDAGHVRVYEIASGVDIEEINSLSSMLLKPNPNNGHFSLEVVDQRHIGSTYRIVDGLGRTIETGTITKPSQDFDLSDKPKGVYRIQVSNENAQGNLIDEYSLVASKTLNVVIQ